MTAPAPRYAIYFAPAADSALWQFGCSVMGYDAASGRDCPQIAVAGFATQDWQRLTAEPRRYGFHATLKAPFRLSPDIDESRLADDLYDLAARLGPVPIPSLTVASMGRFCALRIEGDHEKVAHLSRIAVEAFEPHRAPLTTAELARRLETPLSDRQKGNLSRYGYPYVHEDFRFHMTLTGRLPADRHADVHAALSEAYGALVPPTPTIIDSLCLFRQASPDQRFTIVRRVPLRGPG